jgi:LysR family transcriptional regulator, transcriptional activator for bauABCD operon
LREKKVIIPQLADVEIRLLKVFRAVTECNGFTNAEAHLNIGRSTISAQMSTLEGRLGLRLCERGPGGFKLTEEGREIYAASTRLFAAMNEFRVDVSKAHGNRYVSMGLVDNMICDPLSPVIEALGRYSRRLPNINIRMHNLSPDEIEERVGRGRIDIGIMPMHEERPGLVYVHLYKERNQLYCGVGHPYFNAVAGAVPHNDTISDKRHVLHGYKHTPLEQASNFGLTRDATSYSVEGTAMLILTGQFLGFLPEHYARNWVDRGEMKPVNTDRYFFDANIVAAFQRGGDSNPVVKDLLDELTETLIKSVRQSESSHTLGGSAL